MNKSRNEIRIGAGTLKNRAVRFPAVADLRPTPSRVKETLFNWLGQNLGGLNVLDLFAGSGALGFEAYSRGADFVVLNDSNAAAFRSLNENAARFALDSNRFAIFQKDAFLLLDDFIAKKQFFDVIFCDPPFSQNCAMKLVKAILALKPNGLLYIENGFEIPEFFTLTRHKFLRAGDVFAHLFCKEV